jgi:rubrerythrin
MDENIDDLVEVYSAADLTEAYFLRDLLENGGIATRVVGDTLTGMIPPGAETAPRLWVFRADEERAREIVDDFERNHRHRPSTDEPPAETWRCPTCGEAVDIDFELCWNCQTPKKPY